VRLGPEAGVPTSRSQRDDGDEGDQSDEDHGGDDAVAEHSPGGATALLGGRSCTPTQQQHCQHYRGLLTATRKVTCVCVCVQL